MVNGGQCVILTKHFCRMRPTLPVFSWDLARLQVMEELMKCYQSKLLHHFFHNIEKLMSGIDCSG